MRLTDRLGVNGVEQIFLRMGWIFREQAISDHGIDAHVEVVEDDKVTGRLLALQIKSGLSWFKETSELGYVYRGEPRHLNYWTEHSLPVILVLYDDARKQAWWCAVSDRHVCQHEKSWSIVVPFSQLLDESAIEPLRSMSLPDFRRRERLRDAYSTLSGLAPRGDVQKLLDTIHLATGSLDLASPFLDAPMIAALVGSARDLTIRLLTTEWHAARVSDVARWHPSMEIRTLPQMHAKLILIDKSLAAFGSANLSGPSWSIAEEAILATTESELVAQVNNQFEDLWLRAAKFP